MNEEQWSPLYWATEFEQGKADTYLDVALRTMDAKVAYNIGGPAEFYLREYLQNLPSLATALSEVHPVEEPADLEQLAISSLVFALFNATVITSIMSQSEAYRDWNEPQGSSHALFDAIAAGARQLANRSDGVDALRDYMQRRLAAMRAHEYLAPSLHDRAWRFMAYEYLAALYLEADQSRSISREVDFGLRLTLGILF